MGLWTLEEHTVMQNIALTHLLDDLEGFRFLRDLWQEKMQASVPLRPMNQSSVLSTQIFYISFLQIYSYVCHIFDVI